MRISTIKAADDIIVPNNVIPGIAIFKNGAKGDIKPNATIAGSSTGIVDITSTGVDAKGSIYLTNFTDGSNDGVLVFGAKAKGNVAPVRIFAGSKTSLNDPFHPIVI